MFSNFIRRNGKRGGNKVNEPRRQQRSHLAVPLPPSPVVLDINDESLPLTRQNSHLAELDFSNSNEEWFPQELLLNESSSYPPFRPAQEVTITRENLTDISANPSTSSLTENVSPSSTSRKKSIPAPIFIPNAHLLIPSLRIGHSAGNISPDISKSKANDPPSNPSSPSVSENLSAISGSTLARALMASSFILPSNERRNSRHRSGIVRQDSATLPRRDSFFLSDSGRPTPIPPVPPIPPKLASASLSPVNPNSGTSTESEYPISDSYITSPDVATSASVSRRISRMQTIPSSVTSTSSPSSGPDVSPQGKGPGMSRPRVFNYAMFDVPKTALPMNSQDAIQYSSREGSFLWTSDDHSLDEFDFVPLEPLVVIASADSDSGASHLKPLLRRGETSRGQRRRRPGELHHVRKDSKGSSRVDGVYVPRQSYALPPATASEHDYGELLNYDLTVSPGTSSSGYQTFPETPMIFSPLFSPSYTVLSKSDSQMLRKFPPTPRSARLAPGRLYSSVKTARRQLSINEGVVNMDVLRRCRSSLSPIQRTPSPKQAKLGVSPVEQVNNEEGFTNEMEALMIKPTESKGVVEQQPSVRPHPLSHVSSSSSYLPEEEALQALARHSALFLPSIVVGDTDALPNQMTGSLHTKSPTSVPLPESADTSPSNSPALIDSTATASSSASPLESSLPTTTTATSHSHPSTCPLFVPSSFLPSPSPPSSRPLSPVPVVTIMSDILASPSLSSSSIPPPPYYAVVSERTPHHPGPVLTPPLSRRPSAEPSLQHSRQASNSSLTSGSVRTRVRARPPLPIGPRKPSGPGQVNDPFAPSTRGRNGSTFSLASVDATGDQGTLWRKLQVAVSKPPPRFQEPPPKWRGLTLEAAQWTFTSEELQEVVSRAIQQSSEGSSLRFLRLGVLEGEIADETHRLELQHTDVKAQYRALVRKRGVLIGSLMCHLEGVETNDGVTPSRTAEELAEVVIALDRLADKMHTIALQLAQLKSLRDVHNASALAMVVRKINDLFVRQVAEKERLQEQIDALQTERDEAWKHAEDIAQDYDTLNDRTGARNGARTSADGHSMAGSNSKRSLRISAVRKSSSRQSEAGLRPRSRYRSSRSSGSATRPSSVDVPPIPRLPSIGSASWAIPTDMSLGTIHTNGSATSETLALAEAQREVYEMLGLSVPPSQASSRRRTMSAGRESDHGYPRLSSLLSFSASSRPVSESFGVGVGSSTSSGTGTGTGAATGNGIGARHMRFSREEWRRAIKSVVLDDAGFKRRLPVPPLKVTHHG